MSTCLQSGEGWDHGVNSERERESEVDVSEREREGERGVADGRGGVW